MELDSKPEKKFLYGMTIVLLVLVLLDKGMTLDIGKEKEIKTDLSPKAAKHFALPEIEEITENPKTTIPESFPEPEIVEKSQSLYYIKFYGSGRNTHSRLVRVNRTVSGPLRAQFKKIWRELEAGPSEEEKKRGLLSTLPVEEKFIKKMRFSKGILYISFSENFAEGVGNAILQDRVDQINYTFFEFPEVKEIVYFMDGKRRKFIGRDNLEIPTVFHKGNRRFVKW
jgi:spore germination protein GerM